MPEMQGLVLKELKPEEFAGYFHDVVAPTLDKSGWKPQGAVLHNTGFMHWNIDGHGNPISHEQTVRNMSVDWVARHFTGGPHFLVTPEGNAMVVWKPWEPGTHSPSWNKTHWGVEMVGDFRTHEFPTVMRQAAVKLLRIMHKTIGRSVADEHSLQFHLEDPRTTHHDCPGHFVGPKKQWLADINNTSVAAPPTVPTLMGSVSPATPVPHYTPLSEETIQHVKDEEDFRAVAYPDGVDKGTGQPRWAYGWGTNIRPDGSPVKQGDTITEADAEVMLIDLLNKANKQVQDLLPNLREPVLRSYIGLVYNIGRSNLAASTTVAAFKENDYKKAAASFLLWDKKRVNGVLTFSLGLHGRRRRELSFWQDDASVFVSSAAIEALKADPFAVIRTSAALPPLPTPAPSATPQPPVSTGPIEPQPTGATNMNGTTPWYASQTIWGGLQAVVGGVVTTYLALRGGNIAGAIDSGQQVVIAVAALASAFGGLQAIIGRFKATKMVGKAVTPAKPTA